MSVSIDNRIVQMTFDNKQFEAAVRQSMVSLKNLDNTIKESSSGNKTSSLGKALSKAGKMLNFAELSSSIESIKNRFSTLGIIGMTVIQNLTNSAVNLAKKGLSAISNALLVGGWQRAANLEQAKFRLEGILKSADKVKAVMEDVNWAVDGTAYGLDEAASAASMFAASGIKAGKEMKTALRGIAGVAAMSGDDYSSIAEIFTTVAAQGKVMGQQLTQLSYHSIPALQIVTDYWNKTHEGARKTADEISDMVSKGKIDFKTFAAAMDDAFGEHAKDANKTFEGALANMQTAMKKIGEKFYTPFRTGLIDVFNEGRLAINSFGEGLTVLINKFSLFTSSASSSLAELIKRLTNKGFFKNIADTLSSLVFAFKDIFASIGQGFENVFGKLGSGSINKLSVKILDIANAFQTWAREQTILTTLSTGFFKVVKTLGTVISHAIDVGKKLFDIFKNVTHAISPLIQLIGGLSNGFLNFVSSVTQALDKLDLFGRISNLIKGTTDIVSTFLDSILKLIVNLFGSVGESLSEAGDQLVDVLFTVGILKIIGGIKDILKTLNSTFKSVKKFTEKAQEFAKALNAIPESITKLLNEVRRSLKQWQQTLKATTLIMIAGALLMTASALKQLSKIPWKKTVQALGGVTASLGLLFGALMAYDKFLGKSGGIGKGGIKEILDQYLNGDQQIKAYGDLMIKFAVSAFVLSKAIESLAKLDWKQAVQGIVGIGIVLGMMVGVCKLLSGKYIAPKMMKGLNGLILMAISMKIFASAIVDLAKIPWEQLGNALLAMGTALGAILIFTLALNKGKDFNAGPIKSFILMAISMKILASALQQLASIPWDNLSNAIVAMGGILIEIGLFTAFTEKIKGGGTSFLLLSAGLLLVANALVALASIPYDSMINSVTTLGIVLFELITVMGIAASFGTGALAMIGMAIALQLLVMPLLALAAIPIDSLVTSLLGLVGIFAIVGTAMALFSAAFVPMLLGALALAGASISIGIFAVALIGLGAALTSVGAGLTAVATGLITLWKVIKGIISDIWSIIIAIGNGIRNLIIGIVGFFSGDAANALRKADKQMTKGSQEIGGNIGKALKKSIAKINIGKVFKNAGTSAVTGMVSGIKSKISNIEKTISSGVSSAVSKVKGFAGKFLSAGKSLVEGVAGGIRNGVSGVISAVGSIASQAISKFKSLLKINSPSKVFIKIASSIPEGIVKGINRGENNVKNAINSLADTTISAFSIFEDSLNPTITPTVDLSQVKNSVGVIDSIFTRNQAMGINARINARQNQNIAMMDKISDGFEKLSNKLENATSNTYNVNGITYDDGSNVVNAVGELVRAVKIERRT